MNIFEDYVDKLDKNMRQPTQHLVILDDEGEVWSTRSSPRHDVVLAQERALRRNRDRIEAGRQRDIGCNLILLAGLLFFCVSFWVTLAIIS